MINNLYIYIQHMDDYKNTLSDSEKKALKIAMDHLGTSFSLANSIGYIQFSNNNVKR
mgnify:FL=1